MFLDIKQMQLGKVRFSETIPAGAMEFFDQQIRQAAPIEAAGSAEVMETVLEIRVRGHLRTCVEAACDRCLEPASFPIDTDFDLVYRPAALAPPGEEVEVGGAETEVGFYDGDGLELSEVLREQILLSLPMQRVCGEECQGICPVCGQNRNLVQCRCHAATADDRWEKLKDLQAGRNPVQ
jgi:uncharacterized protein